MGISTGLLLLLALPAAAPIPAEAELASVRAALPRAIADWDGNLDEGDRARWTAEIEGVVADWMAFRDASCDARLLAYETGRPAGAQALACRERVTRAAAEDLRFRYGLEPAGRARAAVDRPGTRPRPGAEDEGPCAEAPSAECDYCGMNHCWEARLKADDARLNAAWRAALTRIAAGRGLSAAARADWTARLRRSQRLWLRWRERDCAVEAWETPNRMAHSIYALVTGPCLAAETEARTERLRLSYGGR